MRRPLSAGRAADAIKHSVASVPNRFNRQNRRRRSRAAAPFAVAFGLSLCTLAVAPSAADEAAERRGEYIFHAAGCRECHTAKDGKPLAGGRAIATPFGDYYSPNITPDPGTGIGRWTEAQFADALRQGVAPDGSHYFPVFPYTSYTGMTDADVADLWAYMKTLDPVQQVNKPHDTRPPFGARFLMGPWKLLHFDAQRWQPDPNQAADVNRGSYLVEVLGHCGECHTPRGISGAARTDRFLAGAKTGPTNDAPNITPDPEAGIGSWSESEIADLLESGMLPDGDFAGGEMASVIEHSTSRLTDADRLAIARFLKSVPPLGPDERASPAGR